VRPVLNKKLNYLSYTSLLFLEGSAGAEKPRSVVRLGGSKSQNSMMSQPKSWEAVVAAGGG
jgi:hypothetical protein